MVRSLSRFVFSALFIFTLAAPTLHAADRAAQRLELDSYLASLESATSRMLESEFARSISAKGNLDPLRQIRDARGAIPRMTDADVAAALTAIQSDITVAAIPRTVDGVFSDETRRRLRVAPDAVTAACSPGVGTPLGITDVYIAKGVSLAANLVMEGFPTDGITILARLVPIAAWGVTETAVLVLEGLNDVEAECLGVQFEATIEAFQTSTTSILNDASRWTSDADLNSAVTTITNNDDSNRNVITTNDNSNRDTILDAINAGTTTIVDNDNANTATIVANDNSNRVTIVNNDNANRDILINELRSLGCDIVRLLNTPEGQRSSAIASCTGRAGFPYDYPEKKSSGVSSSNASFDFAAFSPAPAGRRAVDVLGMETAMLEKRTVPSYYLPSSRGGSIEEVKQHVWRTIEAQADLAIAVQETAAARAQAIQGDALLESGSFVAAYRSYAAAFRTLLPAE